MLASFDIRMWKYWDIHLNRSDMRKEKGDVVTAIKLLRRLPLQQLWCYTIQCWKMNKFSFGQVLWAAVQQQFIMVQIYGHYSLTVTLWQSREPGGSQPQPCCSTYLTAEPCSTSEPTVVLNVKAPEVWQASQPQKPDLVPLGSCSLLCIRATERNSIQDLWSKELPSVQPKVPTQVKASCNFDTNCKLLSWCLGIVSNIFMTQLFTLSSHGISPWVICHTVAYIYHTHGTKFIVHKMDGLFVMSTHSIDLYSRMLMLPKRFGNV